MEYLHSLSQGGGKDCQSWATPSVPFPPLHGLGSERQTTGRGELPVYPASSRSARHFAASQLLLGVDRSVTHFVDEKPEAQAKEAMVFLQSAQPGSCSGLPPPQPRFRISTAQDWHSCPRTGSCVRQDQLSTVATSARPCEPSLFPTTCCWAPFCSPGRRNI